MASGGNLPFSSAAMSDVTASFSRVVIVKSCLVVRRAPAYRSLPLLLLHQRQFPRHRIGQTEAPLVRDLLRVLSSIRERNICFARAAAERTVGVDALEHRSQKFVDEHGLEIFGRLAAAAIALRVGWGAASRA